MEIEKTKETTINVVSELLLNKLKNDDSEYFYLTLSNKLNVFIIYDENVINSAVTMRVNVGYMEDKIPGQAHLLEHMLFVGTKKSNETNYFSKFVESNNGHTNAYTSDDHTCYYYEIANDKLLESLDMFSDFFTSPTLSNESIAKEKEAVNAEHSKNKYNDSRLNYEMFKKAMNQDSPFSKFSTGCNETLNCKDIGEKIREFYDTYYSSNIMTLAIITNKSFDDVKKNVLNNFGLIENKDIPHNNNNDIEFIKQSKFVFMNSVSDSDELRLNWNVKSYYKDYKKSPLSYVSHLLGSEEKNTIHDILLNMGYIKSLSTGISYNNRNYSVFSITVKLTELGFNNYEQIVDIIYDYIELLKNNYDKLSELYDDYYSVINFRFNKYIKYDPLDRIFNLINSYNDMVIEPNLILIKNTLIEPIFENIHYNFMTETEKLNKNNCIMMLKSKKANEFCQPCNKELTYYEHIKYHLMDVNNENNKMKNMDLKLFDKNHYISVLDEINIDNSNDKIILPGFNAFMYRTNKYNVPDVFVKLNIKFSSIINDLKNRLYVGIYLDALETKLNAELYKISCAGYHINLSCDYESSAEYNINISGNRGKIFEVFRYIIANIGINIENQYIDLEIEKTKKYCLNYKYNEQYKIIFKTLEEQISNVFMTNNYVLENIDEINFIDDQEKINELIFKNNQIKMVICGNTDEDIEKYTNLLTNKFNCVDKTDENICYDLKNCLKHITKPLNQDDKNCSVGMYYNICNNNDIMEYSKSVCALHILNTQLNKEFFTQLRTNECFGYIVSASSSKLCYNKYDKKINLFQRFLIQSPNKNTDEIITRIKIFIEQFNLDYNIDDIKLQIIDELSKDHESLGKLASYYFDNTYGDKFVDMDKLLIKTYEEISFNDIKKTYETYIKFGNFYIIGFDATY